MANILQAFNRQRALLNKKNDEIIQSQERLNRARESYEGELLTDRHNPLTRTLEGAGKLITSGIYGGASLLHNLDPYSDIGLGGVGGGYLANLSEDGQKVLKKIQDRDAAQRELVDVMNAYKDQPDNIQLLQKREKQLREKIANNTLTPAEEDFASSTGHTHYNLKDKTLYEIAEGNKQWNETQQRMAGWTEAANHFMTDEASSRMHRAETLSDLKTTGEPVDGWDTTIASIKNASAGDVGEGLGSILGIIGTGALGGKQAVTTMLSGDAFRVAQEGRDQRKKAQDTAFLTGSETEGIDGAAALYGALNAVEGSMFTGQLGKVIPSKLASNRAAAVAGNMAASGLTESGVEYAQTALEQKAAGREDVYEKGYAAALGLFGGAGGGVITSAQNTVNEKAKERNELLKNITKHATFENEDGTKNKDYNPVQAAKDLSKFEPKTEEEAKFKSGTFSSLVQRAEERKNNAERYLNIMGMSEEDINNIPDDKVREETRKIWEETQKDPEFIKEAAKLRQKEYEQAKQTYTVYNSQELANKARTKRVDNPTYNNIAANYAAYSGDEIEGVANNEQDEERKNTLYELAKLRRIQDSIAAQSISDVSEQIAGTSDKNSIEHLGLLQYQDILDASIENKDRDTALEYQKKLQSFSNRHNRKATAIANALATSGNTGKPVFLEQGTWREITQEEYSKLPKGKRLAITTQKSEKLAREVAKEAALLKQMEEAYSIALNQSDLWITLDDSVSASKATEQQTQTQPTTEPVEEEIPLDAYEEELSKPDFTVDEEGNAQPATTDTKENTTQPTAINREEIIKPREQKARQFRVKKNLLQQKGSYEAYRIATAESSKVDVALDKAKKATTDEEFNARIVELDEVIAEADKVFDELNNVTSKPFEKAKEVSEEEAKKIEEQENQEEIDKRKNKFEESKNKVASILGSDIEGEYADIYEQEIDEKVYKDFKKLPKAAQSFIHSLATSATKVEKELKPLMEYLAQLGVVEVANDEYNIAQDDNGTTTENTGKLVEILKPLFETEESKLEQEIASLKEPKEEDASALKDWVEASKMDNAQKNTILRYIKDSWSNSKSKTQQTIQGYINKEKITDVEDINKILEKLGLEKVEPSKVTTEPKEETKKQSSEEQTQTKNQEKKEGQESSSTGSMSVEEAKAHIKETISSLKNLFNAPMDDFKKAGRLRNWLDKTKSEKTIEALNTLIKHYKSTESYKQGKKEAEEAAKKKAEQEKAAKQKKEADKLKEVSEASEEQINAVIDSVEPVEESITEDKLPEKHWYYGWKVKGDKVLATIANYYEKVLAKLDYEAIKEKIGRELTNEDKKAVRAFNILRNSIKGYLDNLANHESNLNTYILRDFPFDTEGNKVKRYAAALKFLLGLNKVTNSNFSTAVAAAITEAVRQHGGNAYNTPEQIAYILYGDDRHSVSYKQIQRLSKAGIINSTFVYELGRNIVANLGITGSTTRIDMLAQYAGAIAVNYLKKEGALKEERLSPSEMKALIEDMAYTEADIARAKQFENIPENADIVFYNFNIETLDQGTKINTVPSLVPTVYVNKNSTVISELLQAEYEDNAPMTSVPQAKDLKDTIKRTPTKVPSMLFKRLLQAAKRPWQAASENLDILNKIIEKHQDTWFTLFGHKTDKELDDIHPAIRDQQRGLRDQFINKLNQQREWLAANGSNPFYLLPVVWKNFRNGIKSTLINPQSSLIDRFLVRLEAWKTTVDKNEELMKDDKLTKHGLYLLALSESMEGLTDSLDIKGYKGKKTEDKVLPADLVGKLKEWIEANSKNIIDAVENLDLERMKEYVDLFDTDEKSIGVLFELYRYLKAEGKFTTYQTKQSDGITNGASTTMGLLGLLTKISGGKGIGINTEQGLEEWQVQETKKGDNPVNDFYESLPVVQNEIIDQLPAYMKSILNSLDKVSKGYATRKLAKAVLTPFVYGAGFAAIARSIVTRTLDDISALYYKGYKNKAAREQYKALLEESYKSISKIKTAIKELNQGKETKENLNILAALAMTTLSNSKAKFMTATAEGSEKTTIMNLAKIFDKRVDNFNAAKAVLLDRTEWAISKLKANRNFSFEDIIPKEHLDVFELLAKMSRGVISVNGITDTFSDYAERRQTLTAIYTTTQALYKVLVTNYLNERGWNIGDLSEEQEEELNKYLKQYEPRLRTVYSDASDEQKMWIGNLERVYVEEEGKLVSIGVTLEHSKKGENKGSSSPQLVRQWGNPGMSTNAQFIQSIDGYVTSLMQQLFPVLNLHDADMFSLDDSIEGTKKQNEAWFRALTDTDIGYNAMEALLRVYEGIKKAKLSEQDRIELANAFDKFYTRDLTSFNEYIDEINNWERQKLEQLSQVTWVHQYGGVEGSLKVEGNTALAEAIANQEKAREAKYQKLKEGFSEEVKPTKAPSKEEVQKNTWFLPKVAKEVLNIIKSLPKYVGEASLQQWWNKYRNKFEKYDLAFIDDLLQDEYMIVRKAQVEEIQISLETKKIYVPFGKTLTNIDVFGLIIEAAIEKRIAPYLSKNKPTESNEITNAVQQLQELATIYQHKSGHSQTVLTLIRDAILNPTKLANTKFKKEDVSFLRRVFDAIKNLFTKKDEISLIEAVTHPLNIIQKEIIEPEVKDYANKLATSFTNLLQEFADNSVRDEVQRYNLIATEALEEYVGDTGIKSGNAQKLSNEIQKLLLKLYEDTKINYFKTVHDLLKNLNGNLTGKLTLIASRNIKELNSDIERDILVVRNGTRFNDGMFDPVNNQATVVINPVHTISESLTTIVHELVHMAVVNKMTEEEQDNLTDKIAEEFRDAIDDMPTSENSEHVKDRVDYAFTAPGEMFSVFLAEPEVREAYPEIAERVEEETEKALGLEKGTMSFLSRNQKSNTTYSNVGSKPNYHQSSEQILANLSTSNDSFLYGSLAVLKPMLDAVPASYFEQAYEDKLALDNVPEEEFSYQAKEAGIILSPAESYIADLTYRAVNNVLDETVDTRSYRVLEDMYQQARENIDESSIPKDIYDYIFKNSQTNRQGKSDHLAKFAALALSSSWFQGLLQDKANNAKEGTLYDKVLEYVKDATDKVYGAGLTLDSSETVSKRTEAALKGIADTHAENSLKAQDKSFYSYLQDKGAGFFKIANAKLKAAIQNVGKTPILKRTLIGKVMQNFGIEGNGEFYAVLQNMVNSAWKNKPMGEVRQVLSEIMGYDSRDENKQFKFFQVQTKTLEEIREGEQAAYIQAAQEAYKDFDKLTPYQKKAITNTLLRTDIQSLENSFSEDAILDLIYDKHYRKQAIDKRVNQLLKEPTGKEFITRAKALGIYMVTGKATTAMLAKNAEAIAYRAGIGNVHTMPDENVVRAIDELATLYAIDNLSLETFSAFKGINDKDGHLSIIKLHRNLVKEGKKGFKDNRLSYNKGYTNEILDPYADIVVVTEDEVEKYEKDGYKKLDLPKDPNDTGKKKYLMTIRNNSRQRYVSGLLGLQNNHHKGTVIYDRNHPDFVNQEKKALASLKSGKEGNYMIPSYNERGDIISFSYESSHAMKDAYLDRDNNFDKVLGKMKGTTAYKAAMPDIQTNLMQAIFDDTEKVKKEWTKGNALVKVAPNAPTALGRKYWELMPYHVREMVINRYGRPEFEIRNDILTWALGYQKASFDTYLKPDQDAGVIHKAIAAFLNSYLGVPAKATIKSLESAILGLVKLWKSSLVVRGLAVIVGNIAANSAVLMLNRLDPVSAMKDISDALVYSTKYQKDKRALRVELARLAVESTAERRSKVAELRDAINRNPLKAFIDAGTMPSIVMDTRVTKEDKEYRSPLEQAIVNTYEKIPTKLKRIADFLLVNEGTTFYDSMINFTQQSDFVFKWAMYQQEMKKGTKKEEALRRVKDTFIDYDVPTSKGTQWMNDMGVWNFTKFALRMQRVVTGFLRRNPVGYLLESVLTPMILGIPPLTLLLLPYRFMNGTLSTGFHLIDMLTFWKHTLPMEVIRMKL